MSVDEQGESGIPPQSVTNPRPATPAAKAAITERFQFGPWNCTATKSHILKSEGPDREKFESELKLPQLPEMIFAENRLCLEHEGGFGLEFNALDALKLVDSEHDSIKVAEAEEWLAARADSEHIKRVVKPFDWTYTTDYMGTVLGEGPAKLEVLETADRIDTERLKQREKIHFYQDLLLFEDELHDSGTSMLSVKVRVMPSCFFVLLRLFMRVDNVVIRINDTRIFHEAGSSHILREFTSRESKISELKVEPHLQTEPNLICEHLPKKIEKFEKLQFPEKWSTKPAQTETTGS